jgi:hypothetical protein
LTPKGQLWERDHHAQEKDADIGVPESCFVSQRIGAAGQPHAAYPDNYGRSYKDDDIADETEASHIQNVHWLPFGYLQRHSARHVCLGRPTPERVPD